MLSQRPPALGSTSNSRLVIFDENKVEAAGPSEPRLEGWTAPPSSRAKENEKNPEKWCDVKVRDGTVELEDSQERNSSLT